jgi:hypothetical protein
VKVYFIVDEAHTDAARDQDIITRRAKGKKWLPPETYTKSITLIRTAIQLPELSDRTYARAQIYAILTWKKGKFRTGRTVE